MPERRIDTELWTHPDFQELCPSAKLLYLYSWSNGHCTAAGIYRISLKTIAFETGLPLADIPQLMAQLAPMDVEWIEPPSVIWVKKFLKHQSKSPLFLKAVANSLEQITDHSLIKWYLKYNDTLSIPYRYPIDTRSLDSDSDSDSDSVKTQTQTQYSGVDRVFLDSMKQRFPGIDVDAEWQDCQTWWVEHRKKMRAPQSALTNWLKRLQAKQPPTPPPDAPRPILR